MPDELVNIEDDDELYRRVIDYQVPDGRVSSAAFKDERHKPAHIFSVDYAQLTTPRESLEGSQNSSMPLDRFRLVGLFARTPRRRDFDVYHKPENGNDAHCNVEGQSDNPKCKAMAREAWIIEVGTAPNRE